MLVSFTWTGVPLKWTIRFLRGHFDHDRNMTLPPSPSKLATISTC